MEKIVKLKPVVKSYIWGGQYFQKYGKGDQEVISELWELSLRDGNSSIIAEGEYKGLELNKVVTKEDVGPAQTRFPYFPLLIKLIDAKRDLSVQVHPSDDYALKNENSFGKSEMWHIIDADDGAGLYIGLKENSSKEDIEKRLNDGTILEALNFVHVKPGDTFVINPGTIHAIGAGMRLIEIQQNSDLTYRLFDYNRLDKDGNPRELHIEKALKVIDYSSYKFIKNQDSVLADNQYFKVKRESFNKELVIKANRDSFVSFTFIDGEGTVDGMKFQKFDTFFLPYGKECTVKGNGVVIISEV
ncbi:MAG: class I mannose-6-phosphate isomerase [Bacilli bacterium]|nr:class I mannose-6-phosphate isomerase [Bacilli bacterium]